MQVNLAQCYQNDTGIAVDKVEAYVVLVGTGAHRVFWPFTAGTRRSHSLVFHLYSANSRGGFGSQ